MLAVPFQPIVHGFAPGDCRTRGRCRMRRPNTTDKEKVHEVLYSKPDHSPPFTLPRPRPVHDQSNHPLPALPRATAQAAFPATSGRSAHPGRCLPAALPTEGVGDTLVAALSRRSRMLFAQPLELIGLPGSGQAFRLLDSWTAFPGRGSESFYGMGATVPGRPRGRRFGAEGGKLWRRGCRILFLASRSRKEPSAGISRVPDCPSDPFLFS
jgi:hypothetical protein